PDTILTNWQAASFDALTADHFAAIAAQQPEIALLGTGARLQFPHPRLSIALNQAGIGLEVMDTKAACRTYNILVAEGRRVVVGIMLS
ncbi:MAG: MTH938/NDUFAF3 family protein, partial [Sulfuriferula sp.]